MGRSDSIDHKLRATRMLQQVQENTRRRLAQLASEKASPLLQSVEDAARLIQDDSPRVRRAAILALSLHWHVSQGSSWALAIERTAEGDRDSRVRREALSSLGFIYAGSDDVNVGLLLARVVLNEHEDTDARNDAYVALCFLRRRFLDPAVIRRFPDCVDWDYVNQFTDPSRTPQPVTSLEAIAHLPAVPENKALLQIVEISRLLESGFFREACDLATQVLDRGLEHRAKATLLVMRAQALLGLGSVLSAVDDLSNAIQLDNRRIEAYQIRSRAFGILGNLARESEDLRRADELDGSSE